jgi:hypothetical protein
MLVPERIYAALQAKAAQFSSSERTLKKDLAALGKVLETFEALSLEECRERLDKLPRPGARPTGEKTGHSIVVPYGQSWPNHQAARKWAMEVLQDAPTFAVDGSQITPSGDFSIPAAVVQVGWFENPHRAETDYVKDVTVEVLTADELGDEDESGGFPGWSVNYRRFRLEVEAIVEYMRRKAGEEPAPLCFFDGSLIVSFAGLMQPERQQAYVEAVEALLDASQETEIPLVGYVDNSSARDLVDMLGHLGGLTPAGRLSDAALLREDMAWGDRSQVFVCARNDNLEGNAYYEKVCFAYLKTTGDGPPARLEFPRWIFEAGLHERLFDLVRGECVVGTGYPYALETADVLAVLGAQDRQRFYRLFQDFSRRQDLPLRYARKARSKRGRR